MQTLKSTGCVLDVRAAPGNKFVDVSRYHHTITNNNVVTVKGMGDALGGGYDGATAYLDCGNPSAFDITDALSIEAWVNVNDIATARPIMFKDYEVMRFIIDSPSGKLVYYGKYGGVSSSNLGNTTVPLNQWIYVAFVYNGASYNYYLNGVDDGSTVISGALSKNVAMPLRIGYYSLGAAMFNGTIFLARIYNRALPAYEILDHYYEYAPLLGLD